MSLATLERPQTAQPAAPAPAATAPDNAVRSRRVHYVAGYDPRGASHYHRLYKEEAAFQAPHLGTRLEVGNRERARNRVARWQIQARWQGEPVSTEYQFMGWDDIVRRHWPGRPLALMVQTLKFYRDVLGSPGLARVRQLSRGAWHSALYPLACQGLAGVITILIALASGFAATALGAAPAWAVAAGLATGAGCAFGAWRLADRLGVFWLLRTCLFIHHWGSQGVPELDARAEEMATHILREQAERPVDEVLLVGHSVGSMLAVQVAARVQALQAEHDRPAPVVLLTLGQCMPYLGLLPGAETFRQHLAGLAGGALPWLDVTAPPDPLCFFNVDPAAACGLPPSPDRPRRHSARVFRMFSPARYARMRRNKLRLHFQYLMSSELPADYDYFRITAGPQRLTDAIPRTAP